MLLAWDIMTGTLHIMTKTGNLTKKLSVSAVILNKDGHVLLLHRSSDREYNPGQWNIVAANVDSHDEASNLVAVEIYQETGLHGRLLLPPVSWYLFFPEHDTFYHDYTFLTVLDEGEIRLDDEHTKFMWIDPQKLNGEDVVPFLRENLHQVGITESTEPYKVLYTNHKNETRWRYITPQRYYFGSTDHHTTEQWLMQSYDHEKQGERTYALADIHVIVPPVFR